MPVGDLLATRSTSQCGLGVEFGGRHGVVDEAGRCGLGAAHRLARQAHLHHRAIGQDAQQIGQDHHREEPDLDLGHAEQRVVARHHQIAGADEAEAAGQRMAVDARDQRQPAGVHALAARRPRSGAGRRHRCVNGVPSALGCRSPPAQKALSPAPVSTTARIARSASASSRPAAMPSATASFSALRRASRSMTIVRTAPFRSMRTGFATISVPGFPSPCRLWRAPSAINDFNSSAMSTAHALSTVTHCARQPSCSVHLPLISWARPVLRSALMQLRQQLMKFIHY